MSVSALALSTLALGGLYFGFKKKDPSIELGSCFFDRLLIPAYTLMNQYYSNSGLFLDNTTEESVEINTPLKTLYACEISGYSTIHNFADNNLINEVFREYKKDESGYFYYVLHKQGKWHKQYIFSHNKGLIKSFANYYNARLLSGVEITNILYDLFLQNTYFSEDKRISRALDIKRDFEEQEPEYMSFKRLTRQAIYNGLHETDILQGFKNLDIASTNIQQLFKIDFEGAIWFYFDLYERRIENHITKMINETKMAGNRKPFLELKERYSAGEAELVVVNSVAFLKKYNEESAGAIGSALKIAYLKKDLFRKDLIRKTLLKFRDGEFDFLAKKEYLCNFIASVHKKTAKKPDIFGTDKSGAFINYSYSEENNNPHSCIIAKPGSGKSVSKQKIMAQMIGLDFKTGHASNLGNMPGNVKIRSYDIGRSDENLIDLIKSNPNNSVAHIASSFYSFSYNLVSIKIPKPGESSDYEYEAMEADIQFAVDLTSVILQSQNSDPLNINEAGMFKKIIKHLYEKNDFRRYRIRDIENTHQETVEQLFKLGYDSSSYLLDIKEDGFDFFKKPLLIDAVKHAKIQAENKQLKDEDRKAYSDLAGKLSAIDSLGTFSTFDKVEVAEADVISMDLNNFKESSLFTPIFLCIFQKTYLKDREFALNCKRKKRASPKLFYAVEEAKNFFRVPYFETMFEKVALEARKYNVHLCFVVQNTEHIPLGIIKNLDTRMFLLTPATKLEVIEEVNSVLKAPKDVIEALSNTEQYELCVWYLKGVFNMRFEITEEEMKVFSTNPNEI